MREVDGLGPTLEGESARLADTLEAGEKQHHE